MDHTLQSRAETLRPGQPVFLVGYHDYQMRFVFVEPYVFIGVKGAEEGAPRWLFQRAESFMRLPLTSEASASRDDALVVDRDGLGTLVDWQGLVGELDDAYSSQQRPA